MQDKGASPRRQYHWGKSSTLRNMGVGDILTVEVSDKSDISGWRVTASHVSRMYSRLYSVYMSGDTKVKITRTL